LSELTTFVMSALHPPTTLLRVTLRSAAVVPSSRFIAISASTFGSSVRRTYADPLPPPTGASKQHNIGAARQGAGAEPDKYVDPYKNGPSALDKAAELFFFTEILRGTCNLCPHSLHCISWNVDGLTAKGVFRNVGCGRANLPTAIHYHVR